MNEIVTIDNAREWMDTDDKFCFCADLLCLSAVDDEAVVDAKVNRLEDKFEALLRLKGEL